MFTWALLSLKASVLYRGKTLEHFIADKQELGLPGGSEANESACNAGDLDSIHELGRSPAGGHGNSSILIWRIPWTEEPGGLQCIESQIDMTQRLNSTTKVGKMSKTRVLPLGASIAMGWMQGDQSHGSEVISDFGKGTRSAL